MLEIRRFPEDDATEFGWAIYECGLDRLEKMDPWGLLLLASICLYSQKKAAWGESLDGHLFYLLAKKVFEVEDVDFRNAVILFLEWLNDCVLANEYYDDYYLLLSWLMLKWELCEEADARFETIVDTLKHRKLTKEDINLNNDSPTVRSDQWLALTEKIPRVAAIDRDSIRDIVCGIDA